MKKIDDVKYRGSYNQSENDLRKFDDSCIDYNEIFFVFYPSMWVYTLLQAHNIIINHPKHNNKKHQCRIFLFWLYFMFLYAMRRRDWLVSHLHPLRIVLFYYYMIWNVLSFLLSAIANNNLQIAFWKTYPTKLFRS